MDMTIAIAICISLSAGAIIGFLTCSILTIASDADDAMEEK